MDRNQRPPDQPSPTTPHPSYTAQILLAAAHQLGQTPARVLTRNHWRIEFNRAVATAVHHLPTPVADKAAATAWGTLPTDPVGATYGEWAAQLRRVAEAV